jgi:hypothetical protein
VALADPFNSQPNPFNYPLFFDRLDHIAGACRVKAAVLPEKRTDAGFVEADEENEDSFHAIT